MNHRAFRNASWIIICRIVQALLNLAISMISARYLGPNNFGLINYAASLVAFVVPLVQLGLRHILVQEFLNNKSIEGEILGTALLMSCISSVLGTIGIICFVSVTNSGETETIIVCILYSLSLVFQTTELTQYWFQAKLLAQYTSVVSLFAYLIISIYKIVLLVTGKSVYWFAVVNALDYCLISVLLYCIYRKLGGQKLSFSAEKAKEMFSRSKYYIVSGMMVTLFAQTDKIMLKLMIGDAVNGYYSAAINCAGMTGFVFAAIIDTMRPIVLESQKAGKSTFEKNMIGLFSSIIYMGLAQSVIITLGAHTIINVLYGSAFVQTVPIVRIVTWYSAFSYIGSARNVWVLAQDKQGELWKINGFGAVINVIGNMILIPAWGAEGAALTTVFTQFLTNFVLCLLIKGFRPCGKLMVQALNCKHLFLIFREIRLKEK